MHGRHGPGALARVPPAQTVRTATQRKAQRDIHHALSYAIVAIASSGRKLRIHHLSEVTWTVLRSTREDRKVRHQAALAPFVTQTNVCVMRLVAPILAGNWGYPQPPDPRSSACCVLCACRTQFDLADTQQELGAPRRLNVFPCVWRCTAHYHTHSHTPESLYLRRLQIVVLYRRHSDIEGGNPAFNKHTSLTQRCTSLIQRCAKVFLAALRSKSLHTKIFAVSPRRRHFPKLRCRPSLQTTTAYYVPYIDQARRKIPLNGALRALMGPHGPAGP